MANIDVEDGKFVVSFEGLVATVGDVMGFTALKEVAIVGTFFRMRLLKSLLVGTFAIALVFTGGAADPPVSDCSVGTTDATGALIIHVFGADSKRPARVHLSTPYGIMMFRAAGGGARFTFADQAKKSVREFDDYDDLLSALAQLPKGSTLTIYDRCTVPLFYDFYPVHQELSDKFSRDCRKRGLKVSNENKLTCTCGTEA